MCSNALKHAIQELFYVRLQGFPPFHGNCARKMYNQMNKLKKNLKKQHNCTSLLTNLFRNKAEKKCMSDHFDKTQLHNGAKLNYHMIFVSLLLIPAFEELMFKY